jgi:hypothetical protein
MSRKLLVVLTLFGAGFYLTASRCSAGEPACAKGCYSKVRVGRPCDVYPRPNYDAIDHSRFDGLLRRFVDCQGMVCYQAWTVLSQMYALSQASTATSGVELTHPKERLQRFSLNNAAGSRPVAA